MTTTSHSHGGLCTLNVCRLATSSSSLAKKIVANPPSLIFFRLNEQPSRQTVVPSLGIGEFKRTSSLSPAVWVKVFNMVFTYWGRNGLNSVRTWVWVEGGSEGTELAVELDDRLLELLLKLLGSSVMGERGPRTLAIGWWWSVITEMSNVKSVPLAVPMGVEVGSNCFGWQIPTCVKLASIQLEFIVWPPMMGASRGTCTTGWQMSGLETTLLEGPAHESWKGAKLDSWPSAAIEFWWEVCHNWDLLSEHSASWFSWLQMAASKGLDDVINGLQYSEKYDVVIHVMYTLTHIPHHT